MKKFFQFTENDWEIVYLLVAAMGLANLLLALDGYGSFSTEHHTSELVLDASMVLLMVLCFFVQRARNKRARLQKNGKPGTISN